MLDWFEKLGLIRVGPYRISVDWMSKRELKKYENASGFFFGDEARIGIKDSLDIDVEREVLMHEVLHACIEVSGLDDEEAEERVIRALAPTLVDVLQRNPKLVRYLRLGW